MAKETWIQGQCQEAEACLRKNNSKKAYQLVKDRTEKQSKTITIQDKSGKCLTEENEILNRWTEYCSDLYNSTMRLTGGGGRSAAHRHQMYRPILRIVSEAKKKKKKKKKKLELPFT